MFGLTPYNRRNDGIERRPRDIFDVGGIFENFFNDSFLPAVFNSRDQMKVDIRETDKEYTVEAELPGVKKEEINIDLRDDRFTITVERNEQINEEKENYIRKERRYGSFTRSFYADNIKHEGVTARFENGILSVVLPKKEPSSPDKRKIDIQ